MSLGSEWRSQFSVAEREIPGLLPSCRDIGLELSRSRINNPLLVSNLVGLEGRRQPTRELETCRGPFHQRECELNVMTECGSRSNLALVAGRKGERSGRLDSIVRR